MALAPAVVGAHVAVYANGRLLGVASDASWSAESAAAERRGVDTLETLELTDAAVSVGGAMTLYRLHLNGGAEGAGLVPVPRDVVRGRYFALMLRDRVTDAVLLRVDAARVTSQAWAVPARGYVVGRLQWRGLTWSNEVEPSPG